MSIGRRVTAGPAAHRWAMPIPAHRRFPYSANRHGTMSGLVLSKSCTAPTNRLPTGRRSQHACTEATAGTPRPTLWCLPTVP